MNVPNRCRLCLQGSMSRAIFYREFYQIRLIYLFIYYLNISTSVHKMLSYSRFVDNESFNEQIYIYYDQFMHLARNTVYEKINSKYVTTRFLHQDINIYRYIYKWIFL